MKNYHPTRFFRTLTFKYGVSLLSFLLIAGFFLWEEHKVHILGYLPLGLALAVCGGMHFFLHKGHAHNRPPHGTNSRDRNDDLHGMDKKE